MIFQIPMMAPGVNESILISGKSALTDLKLGRIHCNKRLYLKKIFPTFIFSK